MNDPFASQKQEGGKSLFTKFRETLNGSTTEGGDPSTPTQQQQQSDFPTMNASSAASASSASRSQAQAHPRTTSEDIDDHMAGSVHQGADQCPSCGYVRMSSVYCPVSQLHHGTDLPAETPRRKKQSLFSRIRDSMSGITPVVEDSDSGVDAPTTNADAADATPSSPAQGITGLFSKSKEEKQFAELAHQEEKARKQIVDIVRLSVQEIDRQLTAVHKEAREAVRANERARNIILFDFKTEFDKFYAERKRELEDFKKDMLMETKLMLKKEKERKKHAETGVQSAAAAAESSCTCSTAVSAETTTPPASVSEVQEEIPSLDAAAEAPLAES